MSKTIDERVVKMEFDNREFESNVKTSMNTLDKLKKSLNFDNVATGLNTLTNISNKMDLRNISRNLDDISGKFSAMGVVGKRVLENLTDSAMGFVNKGLNFAREKLIEGGKKRALDIEKARFSLQGILGDAAQVTEVMEQARESVSDTAYAFNEAANAAASLTASGVKSGEELERAMKAIAGTAATTNSEYERIAHVFTTVAGNGRLMGEQLNQLSSAGMNAAVTLSKYVNDVLQGNITDVSSSVRSSIDAIIATLDEADEAGDKVTVKGKKKLKLTVKNVSESGKNIAKSIQVTEADIRNAVSKSAVSFDLFSEAMSRAYGEHAKDANKTFTGSLANIGAKFAQIGEKFYAPLIEQEGPLVKFFNTIMDKLKEAKSYISPDDPNNPNNLATMFVELAKKAIATANDIVANLDLATFFDKFYNILTKVINQLKSFDKVNHTWEAFVTFGKSLWNVFKFLLTVVKPLGKAFKEMFPLNTERTLLDVAKRFEEFTKKLSLTQKESDNLKDTFKGAIAIFKLLGKAFVDLFNLASPGTSTLRKLIDVILEITGSIGRFLVNLDNMTKTSDSKFRKFGEGIAKVFSWISEKVGGAVGLIVGSFAKLAGIEIKMPTIPPSVQTFIDTLNNIKTQAIDKLTKAFDAISKIKIKLPKIDGELTLSSIFKTINSSVKQFIEQFKKNLGVEKFTIEGFFNGLTEAIGGGTLTLKGVIHGTFDVLKEFVTGTQDILTSLNFKAVVNAIKLGALVAFVYRFHMTTLKLKSIGMAWEPMTVSLKRTLMSFRGTLSSLSNELKSEAVKNLAESIALLVGSLAALALIPADKLTKATGVLTIVIGEFTAMLTVIGKFMKPGDINIGGGFNSVGKITNGGVLGELAAPIMAFAGLLLTMIPVFTKLGKMDWDSINKGLKAIGTVAGSISAIFVAIGTGNKLGPTKNYKEMAGMMVVMAGMLTVIIGSLSKLKDTDAASILATMGGITAALSVLFAFFKSNGNSLAPVALANTPGQLIALAISISILAGAMKKIVDIVGSSSPGATLASFGGIVTFIYMLSKATGGLGGTMGSAASLIALGIALRLLVKPLKAIADLSLSNPWGLVGGVGALMLLIIALGAAGPALDAAAPGIYGIAAVLGGIAGVIASLGAMFAGIGLMVGMTLGGVAKILVAVKDLKDLLKETDADDMRQMLFALADGIGEFVLRINKINLKGTISIGPIADVISAMSNLTPAVKELAALPTDQVDTAFTALGNAMRSFGDAFRDDDFWMATNARSAIGIGVGKAIGNYGKAKGIALLMQNVGALSQLCTTVVGIHVHELETSLSIIQSCFYSFGRALDNAPFWNPTGRGKGIDKLCDGATKLITTISSLIMGDGFNREKLSQFSQVMSEIKSGFLIFADVLKKAPFWNPTGRGAGISLLVSGIEKLVKGVKAMVDSEITGTVFQTRCKQIAKGLETITGAMNTIEKGSSAYSRGKGLSIIMRSIKSFAIGVKEFLELANNKNYSTNYSVVMGQIGDTLKEFGEALDKSGFWSSHRAEGLKIIINGLPKLGKAITTMVADNKDRIGDFCEIMDQAGITLKDFGSAMKEAGFWNPEGKGKGIAQVVSSLSQLGDAIKKLVEIQEILQSKDNPQTIETYFATYKNLLIDLISILKSADSKIGAQAERVKKIADALKVFANAAKELDKHIGASLTKRLRSFGEAMESAGGKILAELGEAFTLKKGSKGSTFVNNVINFFKTVVSKISDAFSSRGALYSKLKNVGTNICSGIATGIRSNSGYNKIRAAINDVINKALNNYSRRTGRTRSVTGNGVASAGAKVTQQFAEGMVANTSSVAQAAGTVGQEALNSLRKAIIYISDMAAENMDLNPVITPVVDLSNVTESAKEISGLFGASNSFKMAGSNSAILAASRSLALANQAASMDNSDVVRAIYGLQTDFKDMSAKLTNLQVVMDSGALVGQISRPLDAALGVRYSRNRREKG